MNQNHNDQIKQLHFSLLKILDEIDRICRNNNINYFLDSGTALGAIRHQGFIPWDDDADVGMPRQDYERFIKIAEEQLGDDFFLQTHETEPEYINLNAKIKLNNTYFPEAYNREAHVHKGIFVDVFPFDYTSDNTRIATLNTRISRILVSIFLFRVKPNTNPNCVKRTIKRIIDKIPDSFFENLCQRFYQRYNDKKTNTLTCYSYRMNSDHMLHFNANTLINTIDIQFENKVYRLMAGYDEYLRQMFGNYMELPPVEKRVFHIDGVIRFE